MAQRNSKIVLVEDDTRLRKLVTQYLQDNNFIVIDLENGTHLLETVATHEPCVIILDIMLPGEDGFSLCKKLRETYPGPLLFMTAKADAIDEILGLELGADDYVIKPVEPRLLLARIQALLRRNSSVTVKQEPVLNFGQLSIDKKARNVVLAGSPISLTSHEFDLLCILADNAGQVVDRDTIYSKVIGRDYDGLDRSADVRISRLRKKLHDDPRSPFRIKTIWGKGFYFVAEAWNPTT